MKTMEVRPGRRVSSRLVLTKDGQLRIPGGLLPDDAQERDLHFILVSMDYQKKVLKLGLSYGDGELETTWRRKAIYGNEDAKSPLVTIKGLLEMLGIQLPQYKRALKSSQDRDGVLEIKF
jgi:hypothetical protein